MTGRHRAAFLDRDGTLVRDTHYLAHPEEMRLLPGVADVLHRFNASNVLVIVVTNQSGIARGLLTEEQYEATRAYLDALMAAAGARIDASYHCPHHPDVTGTCDCRKPGTALYLKAARDFDIDVTQSLYVGDRFRDVQPGIALNGMGILVPSAETPRDDVDRARREASVAATLHEACETFEKE